MKIKEAYTRWIDDLKTMMGFEEAKAVTRAGFEDLCGLTPVDVAVKGDDDLTESSAHILDKALLELKKGKPIQYITGVAWFHGLKLYVNPSVLIPRRETSLLVDIIADDYKGQTDLSVIDLCAGSGAIALALARNLPFSQVTGVELSEAALAVALENSKRLHCKVKWIEGNVLDKKQLPLGPFDIIVSNPPYIPHCETREVDSNVLANEPPLALFVEDERPVLFYEQIALWAVNTLSAKGTLYFEINPHYSADVVRVMKGAGFTDVRIERDMDGRERFVKGKL